MTRRYPERPEMALNVLQRWQIDDLDHRHVTRRALRFARINPWCTYINAGASTRAVRFLYDEIRPGQLPRYDWRRRAIVTVDPTAKMIRALAAELEWRVVDVDQDHLLALAAGESAEERGLLW